MQSQQNIQKIFFEQLKPGDYVDARYGDDDWKIAKIIERQNKYLTIIYDGMPPNNEQVYINTMRVKPLRAVTVAYTGPTRNIYLSITSIPELSKHIQTLDIILKATQPPSPYKTTQYLRGQLFTTINSLLISDIKLSQQQIQFLNNFLIQFTSRIGKLCQKSKQYLKQYFDSNSNSKYSYLINYKLAIIYSLGQLLYLINLVIAQNSQMPKLCKNYKNQILQNNLITHFKQFIPILTELSNSNDGAGRWLPTYTRMVIAKILLKYKEQDRFINVNYDIKDYLEFYSYWPMIIQLCPTQPNQKKFIMYIHNVMCNQSPFDAKLKSLLILRKILDKQHKLSFLSSTNVIQLLNNKKIIDSLLKYFNPQIFKRYIPILKHSSQYSKKILTQAQIDDLFKIMKTSHESQHNLIYQIIVNISQFISIDALDSIYTDIEKNIDINNQNSIKFVRDFTIKAIQNYNMNKNKGFLSALIGRKKCSSKFQYYGLNMFFKEIQDGNGKIIAKNIAFVIGNIGTIFQNQCFHHERLPYMQTCLSNIQAKQSYGQSVRVLQQILCTYPPSTYLGQSQQSVVAKLDDKYKLVDTLINALKPLQKQCNSPNVKNIKVNFETSIKYFFSFLQQFGIYFKNTLQLRHINFLWHMPHIFQFLRKARESNDSQLPVWKRKYLKKISIQIIKGILNQIIKHDQNIIPTQQCFQAVHQLILSYNLNKSIQLTQRATIRYKNLSNILGLSFYFKFLEKLIAMYRVDWKKNRKQQKNIELVQKVIKIIFEFHLRPTEYFAIDMKCQNLLNCLMKVIKAVYKDNIEICVNSIQLCLDLIKGRLYKDINASGKLDVLVSYQNKQKTITLPKNATILKLRNVIMDIYKIKWNFQMFNTSLKRQVKFTEEQDFSINAMGHAIKGPTIIVRKVQEGQLYPIFQSYQKLMSLIQQEQQFYKIVFGLLQIQTQASLHARIWKIIERVPVNRVTKNKIKNCKDFTKKDWEQFLLPNLLEQLQYSINIVYGQLGNPKWLQDFKKTQGGVVVQELYLTMLKSIEPLSEKIKTNLSKIILKILQHSTVSSQQQKKAEGEKDQKIKVQQKQNTQNLQKISKKIMQQLENQIKKNQYSSKQIKLGQKQSHKKLTVSIEYLNLMMKILLTLSLKKNCPQIQIIIKYFLHDGILLNISDLILFQPKDTDTTFFTEDILEKVTLYLSLQQSYKIEILRQFLTKYLNYNLLVEKTSTQNYFMFLITFLQNVGKDKLVQICQNTPQIVKCIKDYIEQTLNCKQNNQDKQNILKELKLSDMKKISIERIQPSQQMLHGCFKLFNQTFTFEIFNYDIEKIFAVLIDKFVLTEPHIKQHEVYKVSDQKVLNKNTKPKNKYKKILYEIIKLMVFHNKNLLKTFIQKVAPKLQKAQWRRSAFSSWSLQQQKNQKKYFCGLQNLAATCYINCLFQQLFMIKRFSDRFINTDSLAYKQLPQSNQIYQLQKLFTYLKYGNKRSYTTRQFCQSFITYQGVPIDPTVQNDADEFFNALMDKIQSFLKSSGHHDILEDTFQGKLSNQLNCQGCPHSSEKIQPFMSVGLNIKNKKTLEAALDGYVQGEILDGDNAYFCQKCQKKVRTMKRMCIKQTPNILVIVLKRFTFNFDQMRKIKINDELKFPQQLNIKKYTSQFNLGQQCKPDNYYDYKLRGVVVHAGTSEGGHYYSFIKQGEDMINSSGKWFQFNDQIIEEADYKRIQQQGFGGQQKDSQFKIQKYKNAYILLYQKNTLIQKSPSNIIQPSKQIQMIMQTQSFEQHLSQLVISENRNSDFLSIILDQNFIRLCENISMCGEEKAHHFILLYFHTVLLRDKNRQQYISNIYRVILTLLNSSAELSSWYLQQVDENYVKQFLIESPKLGKYFCLGLIIQAIKVLQKYDKQPNHKSKVANKIKNMIETVQITKKNRQIKQQLIKQNKAVQTKQNQQQPETQTQSLNQAKLTSTTQPENENQNQANLDKNNIVFQQQQQQQIQQSQQISKILKKKYIETVKNLIPRLVACIKNKGMTPFAKIFTFLSSIPEFKEELQKYQYAERVAQIVLSDNSRYYKKIQYPPVSSYFGHQSPANKQRQLQHSYSFLVESLRYYHSILTKQQILNLLSSAQSRPTTKSLCYLLTKTIQTPQQALQTLQQFQLKLMDQKYKREDIEKYMFMIRYYYLFADGAKKKNNIEDQTKISFVEDVKIICLNSLTTVVKANQNSHMVMEMVLVQINKIAWKSQDFKTRWIQKVYNNEGLYKSLVYWLAQSKRPHFLSRNDQWKKKVANLSYQQKDIIISQNQTYQKQRVAWMLSKKDQKQQQMAEIHSDLELTAIGKNISIGFKFYKIIDRLGILTKVEDQKGICRWAILEKNQIQTYLDF